MKAEKEIYDTLVGKSFKRNVYGLSTWTDEITYVGYAYNIINRTTSKVEMYVLGTKTKTRYALDEIVIVNRKLNMIEEIQLHKTDISERIGKGEDASLVLAEEKENLNKAIQKLKNKIE
jgi:hypothetical protein